MHPEISAFVDSLSQEEEDRVLTGKLAIGKFYEQDGEQCLVGRACGAHAWEGDATRSTPEESDYWKRHGAVAWRFDGECKSRGVVVVAAEIRDRIWANRAARMPAPHPTESPELVHALSH